MSQLCGHSITYRIGVGPQAGRKVFTLQTLPACDHRALVTPAKRGKGNKAKVADGPPTSPERRASMTWAQRLKRVFSVDIETCRACGGAVRIVACIEDPVVINNILDHLKEKDEYQDTFRLPESRGAPQTSLFG